MPAIPEQASASRKRPEEEEEEDSVQSKSGPALLALRMRCGLGARAEVPGFGTHADYGGGGEHGATENGACAWFLWAGLVFGWAGRSLDFKFESRVFGSFGGTE